MDLKRSLDVLSAARLGNTFPELVCFSRLALADLARSLASLRISSTAEKDLSGPGGVRRALAEFTRRLRLTGRLVASELILTCEHASEDRLVRIDTA